MLYRDEFIGDKHCDSTSDSGAGLPLLETACSKQIEIREKGLIAVVESGLVKKHKMGFALVVRRPLCVSFSKVASKVGQFR